MDASGPHGIATSRDPPVMRGEPGATGAVAVVAAHQEADRIAATVRALLRIPGVRRVVVADDGSRDGTAAAALAAGAAVIRSGRNRGKGAALERAIDAAGPAEVILLTDADLAESAGALEAVLGPVLAGDADLAVAVPPAPPAGAGGFGLVRRSAAWMIERASGYRARAPLSGQRAVTRRCLEACRPLAPGFGVEAAMTADAARLGFRVAEVEAPVVHRFTGRDAAGFGHRAVQGADIVRAMVPRVAGWR
ncbi:MAG TPA: glycosyltransferase [Actinomycetota bacterium]